MDDKSRIVKATEGLKGVAQQALAIKDVVADLVPVAQKAQFDLPFTSSIAADSP